MPQTIQTTVYVFDELDERAKERARAWWRQGADVFEWDYMYDDFRACATRLGIDIGGTDTKPAIYWSGFSSQGDGASFAGTYAYACGARRAIRAYAPQDAELQRIATELEHVQRRYDYALTAYIVAGHSHYAHEMTMCIDVDGGTHDVSEEDAKTVRDALRDFARWMYRALEREYDYQMSDECVDETIRANEYTFTAEGKRFG